MSHAARVSVRADDATRAAQDRPASPGEVAWLLLVPAIAVGLPLVALLAGPLGGIAFPAPPYHYWDVEQVVRKPTVQAGYALAVMLVLAYALAVGVVVLRGLRLPPRALAGGALAVQLVLVAFAIVCWVAQHDVDVRGTRRMYFSAATLLVAAAATLPIAWLARERGPSALGLAIARLRLGSRAAARACLVLALLSTAVWLLPTVYTEGGLIYAPGELHGNAFAFDEALAVLDGRSPLVDIVAYGTLWPYAIAPALGAFGGSYTAFTVLMALLTGLGMLAVYGLLRRVTRSAPAALALYLPVLATGFFIERGTLVARYHPGNYFGVFPLRLAGPYLLAWLVARQVDPRVARRLPPELLFAAAGLVGLNNVDFGGSALAATVLAVLVARPPEQSLRRLARGVVVGLAAALALVSLLTLLRAGTLPHLGLLVRYGRVFASGGFGNFALPALGLHLLISSTFVAALATAAARRAAARPNRVLTAMLAWTGLFGLGASVYYYAYRSQPDVLINLFSTWSLALALLVVAVVGDLRASPRSRPTLAQLAVLFGFGISVCSLAQLPLPWDQIERIERGSAERPFRLPELARLVAAHTRAGERVVILSPVGHRIAYDAGVVNVSPYTGLLQMPAVEQFDEVLGLLAREGGRSVFVFEPALFDAAAELSRRGFAVVPEGQMVEWNERPVTIMRATRPR